MEGIEGEENLLIIIIKGFGFLIVFRVVCFFEEK